MEVKLNDKKEENINLKEIQEIDLTKKYPFLGFSPSLIDYFLILGYEIPSKDEIMSNFLKIPDKDKNNASFQEKKSFQTELRPAVLNSIGTDFTDAALDEELIIKHMFPNKLVTIYYENLKNERNEKKYEKKDPQMQNIILYLKANKIYEFDEAHNEKDKNLKNDIMFNVYGLLFWESHIIEEGNDKKRYKIYFPKILVFISQYTCFNYFCLLSQDIASKMKQYSVFQVPLEIQLYNIVNFTPSPINCTLGLEFLINKDLLNIERGYSKANDEVFRINKKNENKVLNELLIRLNQLTGFPFLDINLPSMFFFFNLDIFIILYAFSFLEFNCLFFCPELDPLNNIMYVLNILSYPFIDLSELGQIYTVSKEEILDKNKIIKNRITGVNCEYDQNLPLPEEYKNYIIIDCKQPQFDMYYLGENMKRTRPNEIISLFHYIKKFLDDEHEHEKKDNFLENKLYFLYLNTQQNFMKYCASVENETDSDNNDTKEILFKKMDFNEKSKNFKYEEMAESNLSIQKSFYSFNNSVLEYFHDMMRLEISDNPENILTDENIKAYYEINFRDVVDKGIITYKNSYTFNEHDKVFFKYFRKTKKFKDYLEKFIKKNECLEIKRQALIMSEEFMNINKDFLFDEQRDYLQIISKYYQTSNKLRKINFNKFYSNNFRNLSKAFYEIAQESKVLKVKSEAKKDINLKIPYTYISKENILDNNIIQRYSYILNNMEQKSLNEMFPHLEFKNKGNKLDEIGQNLFADFLESYLIDIKIYNLKQVVSFIILIIYIISLKKNKLLFHFFEEIMKSELVAQKSCLRKYIYFILYLLNEKVKEKIKADKNIIGELLIYKEIMSCIYSMNEKYENFGKSEKFDNRSDSKSEKDEKSDKSNKLEKSEKPAKNEKKIFNGYYPNGLLANIINNFNFYQNYYAVLLVEHPQFSEKNKIMIDNYNNYESEILEEGVDYKVFMQNNSCEDKGAIKDEVLVGITEALEYKGVIQTTCKTCKFKIKPNLFFVHVPIDKCNSIPFCSIIYSYKISLKILKKILDNNDKGNIDEEYFNLCGNMIFYINYKESTNNLLSRYIATSLK